MGTEGQGPLAWCIRVATSRAFCLAVSMAYPYGVAKEALSSFSLNLEGTTSNLRPCNRRKSGQEGQRKSLRKRNGTCTIGRRCLLHAPVFSSIHRTFPERGWGVGNSPGLSLSVVSGLGTDRGPSLALDGRHWQRKKPGTERPAGKD